MVWQDIMEEVGDVVDAVLYAGRQHEAALGSCLYVLKEERRVYLFLYKRTITSFYVRAPPFLHMHEPNAMIDAMHSLACRKTSSS